MERGMYMNFYADKQVRHLCIFLIFFVILFFASSAVVNVIQTKTVQEAFLLYDSSIATSLLEQGIPKDVIAKAVTSTTKSRAGTELISTIGVTKYTSIRFLPYVGKFEQVTVRAMFFMAVFLLVLLFAEIFNFLWKREELYKQALKVIDRFTEGDFSCHMPQMKEGTIYRLFTSIDQLSTTLQSKNEAEHNMKEFLKKTISDISHQLKTPLAALSMYNEIISDEPGNIETVKKYSKKTELSLKRMKELIQSMLKITRLDAESIVFEKRSCSVSELISEAVCELTTRAKNERKKIIIDGSHKETITCDRQWTNEAIGNIVKNALDHTGSGGEVHISWNRTPAMIRIFISDNGTGILPEDLHHIFKRFYRSKKSLDTQGIGLGLSLAKSIIEGQGGIISVQSTLHEGAVFIISFLTEM